MTILTLPVGLHRHTPTCTCIFHYKVHVPVYKCTCVLLYTTYCTIYCQLNAGTDLYDSHDRSIPPDNYR